MNAELEELEQEEFDEKMLDVDIELPQVPSAALPATKSKFMNHNHEIVGNVRSESFSVSKPGPDLDHRSLNLISLTWCTHLYM